MHRVSLSNVPKDIRDALYNRYGQISEIIWMTQSMDVLKELMLTHN